MNRAWDRETGSRHISRECCPWNSFAEQTAEEAFRAREGLDGLSHIEWMTMTQEAFSAPLEGSPIKRAKRRGLLRDVALGSRGSQGARGPVRG